MSMPGAVGAACTKHPNLAAVDRCAGCAEPFCGNCLVEIQGQKYCGACKSMTVRHVPVPEQATEPCQEATDSLKYAIIGLFCFGIVLGPIAIAKALKAKKMMAANPRLAGSGKATAGLIIGIIVTVLWVLGMFARISEAQAR